MQYKFFGVLALLAAVGCSESQSAATTKSIDYSLDNQVKSFTPELVCKKDGKEIFSLGIATYLQAGQDGADSYISSMYVLNRPTLNGTWDMYRISKVYLTKSAEKTLFIADALEGYVSINITKNASLVDLSLKKDFLSEHPLVIEETQGVSCQ